jgi:hypothetical protein
MSNYNNTMAMYQHSFNARSRYMLACAIFQQLAWCPPKVRRRHPASGIMSRAVTVVH